jgi:hypothetical protein
VEPVALSGSFLSQPERILHRSRFSFFGGNQGNLPPHIRGAAHTGYSMTLRNVSTP